MILLCGNEMRASDIEEELQEMDGCKLSTSALSTIAERVRLHVLDWQHRPLDGVCCVVWMGGVV